MACKTSIWEDESNYRVSDQERLAILFEKWRWEIIDTEEWIRTCLDGSTVEFPGELINALEVAARYSSADPPAWSEQIDSRVSFTFEEREAFQVRKHAWYRNRVEELEESLCAMRTWIMKHHSSSSKLTRTLELAFEREKKLHTQHRSEDRDHKMKRLKNRLTLVRSKASDEPSSAERDRLMAEVHFIEAELKRIADLSIEKILSDQNVF